jgi:hypothetical protein
MSPLSDLPPELLEKLSAYLDRGLSASETAALEARLEADAGLRRSLDEMRQARAGLGMLPRLRVPRNFTLTPEMAGVRPARWGYPRLRLATVVATLAFLFTLGVDTYTVRLAGLSAARLATAPLVEGEAQAPQQAAAETLLDAAQAPAALPQEAPAEASAERAAGDLAGTPIPTATVDPLLKGGALGMESAPLGTATAAPAPAPPLAEVREQDEVANFAASADEERSAPLRALMQAWQVRPLRFLEAALGALILVLALLAFRARRRA